jgi:hypothetical protein
MTAKSKFNLSKAAMYALIAGELAGGNVVSLQKRTRSPIREV